MCPRFLEHPVYHFFFVDCRLAYEFKESVGQVFWLSFLNFCYGLMHEIKDEMKRNKKFDITSIKIFCTINSLH